MQNKIKKIIPYFFILVILVGFLSPTAQVQASQADPTETCNTADPSQAKNTPCTAQLGTCTYTVNINKIQKFRQTTTQKDCTDKNKTNASANATWVFDPTATTPDSLPTASTTVDTTGAILGTCSDNNKLTTQANCTPGHWTSSEKVAPAKNQLAENIPGCAVITGDFDDCLVKIAYVLFYTIPAFLLGLAANTFNLIISLTLSSTMYTRSTFIPEAWGVVRDLSNLFFIIVLIYVAIEMILGMAHDAKKMIAHIIIMALLINFSMFFSEVIVDTSNILALIFYNRIDTCTVIAGQNPTNPTAVSGQNPPCAPYLSISDSTKTGVVEKDIAGGIVSKFDPSRMLSADFFQKAKTQTQRFTTQDMSVAGATAYVAGGALVGSFIPVVGTAIGAGIGGGAYVVKSVVGWFFGSAGVPVPLMLGIILISGLTMAYTAYSFAIVGLAFVSRLIELWVLIIFSPFAFMSSSVPFLEKAEGIGWDEWIKSIVRVSFMAPVFMFFLYLTFKIINADLFANLSVRTYAQQGTLEAIILMTLPALVILIILHKATIKAKKWSGELGEMLTKAVEVGGAVAGGLALGGAASALQASVGKYSDRFAQSKTAKRWIKEGRFGADSLQRATSYLGGASFDARKGAVGAVLSGIESTTGLRVGASSKLLVKDGGYRADRERMVKKRQQRAEEVSKVGEDEELTQDLHKTEDSHQELLTRHGSGAHEIQLLDNKIKVLSERSSVASRDSKLASSRVPGGPEGSAINPATGNTFGRDAELARNALSDAQGERGAIKNATMFRRSDGTMVDHRSATTNNNLSEDAITGIENTARAAILATTANPADTGLANSAAIAIAARDAAYATRDVTLIANRDAANTALAANPADTHLIEAAAAATRAAASANVAASTATAKASALNVDVIAKANPTDARLVNAGTAAADALKRIASGLSGRSINNLEDTDIPAAHHEVEHENKERARAYANRLETGGSTVRKIFRAVGMQQAGDNFYSRREAAYNIRKGAKLDSGTGGKGH